jgi:transglutaminase-like putative cysteine protease
MRKIILSSSVIIALLISCNTKTDNLDQLIQNGNFSEAMKTIDLKLQNKTQLSSIEIEVLQKKQYDIQAVKNEYTLSYDDVYKKLKTQISDLSAQDMRDWKNDYSLEYYLIDGEIKYYYNCSYDLFQVNEEAANRAGIQNNSSYDYSKYPMETINALNKDTLFTKNVFVGFSFFQNLETIPLNGVLRVWIPFVRDNRFQKNIKIVDNNIKDFSMPKKELLTSMIYFEHKVTNGYNSYDEWDRFFTTPKYDWMYSIDKPEFVTDSTFLIQFIYQYTSRAYYNRININTLKSYNTNNSIYEKYTKETELNQFTDYLRKLSEEIVGSENNPYDKAKLIYKWVCENIIWTQPKAVMGDNAEYTAKYKRGDCGAKSNLFISLCRINNIPTRSQGGWLIRPNGGHAQHSWAQVYFEAYGWLPVDVTFGKGLINHEDERLKYFHFGNCTPYRLIIYDDDSQIHPHKQHSCLTGGGAQLGVFQWEGGDLEPFIKLDSYVE